MTGLAVRSEVAQQEALLEVPTFHVDPDPTLRARLLRFGMELWPVTYKHAGGSDVRAAKIYYSSCEYAEKFLAVQSFKVMLMGSTKWVDSGLPVIRLGEKLSAALMATKTTPLVAEQMKTPFPAFVLEWPSGLLETADGSYNAVLVLPLNIYEPLWAYYSMPAKNGRLTEVTLHMYGESTENFLKEVEATQDLGPLDIAQSTEDRRVHDCLRRLVCGFCLSVNDTRKELKQVGKGHASKRGEPVVRVYQFVKDVSFDAREAIRDYVAARKNSLALQFMVSGHWKQQPHGPKNSLRRAQWIEPYWKGPDDAPIRVGSRRA